MPVPTLKLPLLQAGSFSARPAAADGAIHLALIGTADLTVKPEFDRFMKALHEEALRLEVREVVVDLEALEFMNSSCFKALVTWVLSIDMEAGPRRYGITFLENAQRQWQRHCLKALSALSPERVAVRA